MISKFLRAAASLGGTAPRLWAWPPSRAGFGYWGVLLTLVDV